MLSKPSPAFAPLLTRLFTTKSVPDILITILLDWSNPWKWPHQLRQWIRLLRSVLITLDDNVKITLEENMTDWKEKRKGVDALTGNFGQQATKDGVPAPAVTLGPGEWDEGLGVPLCIVCQNAEKIERLEKELGWEEGEFDFIAQWMRTVLLKRGFHSSFPLYSIRTEINHLVDGASCIYTTPFDSNSVRLLIHSSLGIHSLLKRETVKYNIVDRDKLLIPPNWDSWAKIRILREGFDMEGVGAAWSTEIQDPPSSTFPDPDPTDPPSSPSSSAVALFAATLPDPSNPSANDTTHATPTAHPFQDPDKHPSSSSNSEPPEVTCPDTQTFLAEQAVLLDRLKNEDAREEARQRQASSSSSTSADKRNTDPHLIDSASASADDAGGRMAEQIGPMQFNVGGIEVDADDAVRQLRERERREAGERERRERTGRDGGAGSGGGGGGGAAKAESENETLRDFFAGLLKKGTGGGEEKVGG